LSRRFRRATAIFITFVGAAFLALLFAPGLLAQAAGPRGVYRVDPDPAETQPGGRASATVDSEDGGQRSCLAGTVPRTPPSGFQLSFASQVSPVTRPRGSTTWSTTAFLDVASNVAPGSYPISIWLQAYTTDGCTGATLGPPYEYWDINVVVPPSPQPTPPPTSSLSPLPPAAPGGGAVSPGVAPSPSPTGSTSTTTTTPSSDETSSVQAGSFEGTDPEPRAAQDDGTSPSRSRYPMALAVDDSSIFNPSADKLTFAALMALVLTLVIVFPSELFNTTWQENSAEIKSWFGLGGERGKWQKLTRKLSRTWPGFGLITLVMAALYGLLSPDFGLDFPSLGLVLAISAALVVVLAANELSAALYTRRHTGRVYLRVFPGAIFIAIFCVAISRLADFQPGYLYGLLAGAAIRGGTGKDIQGKSAAVASFGLLAVSVAAWFAWLPVRDMAASANSSQTTLLLEAFLVATFVAGLEGLLFGLLPLTFLDGHKLASWNRALWAALFFVSAFAFVFILLDPDASYVSFSADIPTAVVLGLFLGFGLFSVAFWSYFRFRRPRSA
jgi:hypothetical protein